MKSIPMITRNLLEIIDIAYSIDNRKEMFHSVCKKLRRLVHFPSAVLLPMHSQTGNFMLNDSEGFNISGESILAFCSYYAPLQPLVKKKLHNKLNGATRMMDIIRADVHAETEYCRDFQSPINIFYELCINIRHKGQQIAGIGLHRARNERDFSDNDKRMVNLLVPHLSNALHHLDMKEENRSYNPGMIIMEENGKPVYINEKAKEILKGSSTEAIPIPEHNASDVFCSSDEGRYRVRTELMGKGQEEKIVYLELLPSECGLLQKLSELGLTLRQQQTAVLAIQGLSNSEIAEKLSINVLTVKDHLQAVFEKVGVNKRGKLIAKILGPQI